MGINAHVVTERKRTWHVSPFWVIELRLFFWIWSSNADKFTVVGCHDHDLNTDHKQRFFSFHKVTVLKEGIWSSVFSAAYQEENGDQCYYYDVGPLCPLSISFFLSKNQQFCWHFGYVFHTKIIKNVLFNEKTDQCTFLHHVCATFHCPWTNSFTVTCTAFWTRRRGWTVQQLPNPDPNGLTRTLTLIHVLD